MMRGGGGGFVLSAAVQEMSITLFNRYIVRSTSYLQSIQYKEYLLHVPSLSL